MEKREKGGIDRVMKNKEKNKTRREAEDHAHAQELTLNTYLRDRVRELWYMYMYSGNWLILTPETWTHHLKDVLPCIDALTTELRTPHYSLHCF